LGVSFGDKFVDDMIEASLGFFLFHNFFGLIGQRQKGAQEAEMGFLFF
jgi:hypothetical protein